MPCGCCCFCCFFLGGWKLQRTTKPNKQTMRSMTDQEKIYCLHCNNKQKKCVLNWQKLSANLYKLYSLMELYVYLGFLSFLRKDKKKTNQRCNSRNFSVCVCVCVSFCKHFDDDNGSQHTLTHAFNNVIIMMMMMIMVIVNGHHHHFLFCGSYRILCLEKKESKKQTTTFFALFFFASFHIPFIQPCIYLAWKLWRMFRKQATNFCFF